MLEETGREMKNGSSRDTGNIGYRLRRKINKNKIPAWRGVLDTTLCQKVYQ